MRKMNGWEGGVVANYELAEKDYMSGMKYKDIAEKYGVSINTVKSWKKRYLWDRKKGAHKNEKGCTQNECNKKSNKEPVAEEVNAVLENTELTEKQRLFCLYFIRSFNATKAYQKAYGCDYYSAKAHGYELLQTVAIKSEIQKLKQERLNKEFLSESDIFQKYMDIAFADITDFMTFGNEKIELADKAGNQRTITVSRVNIKNDYEVDGTIISEISQGKDGIKVKLADRMKALEWLTAHMGMATEEQKVKLALLQAQKEKILEDKAGGSSDDKTQQKKDNIASILNQIKPLKDGDILE